MSGCRMQAVPCEACGAIRLGAAITDAGLPSPHAPHHASQRVQAQHRGPWPTCRHGLAWLLDCVDRPVPPSCCQHPPCALTLPPPEATSP